MKVDDVAFQPNPNRSPIGSLEGVSLQNGTAYGWSLDPDSSSASNSVHCYIDNVFAGATTANLPSPDVPYPGNHRYAFSVPIQYRDGNQHTISCYGLDVTGGDPPTALTGSPRTFRFNAPIGYFDLINADGEAIGWSLDPDVPAQSNTIHFYIDGPAGSGGTYIGEIVANIPRPDVNQQTGYPGNHGFRFYIPAQYRNNQTHTLYAYGLDLTGDNSRPLIGNPKSFNLSPGVVSTTFAALPNAPLTPNNNPGNGLRIFPERATPTGPINNRVNVKARISVNTPGVPVYFYSYDLDDPSANTLPLDDETNLRDNRSDSQIGTLCPSFGAECVDTDGFRVLTDANGEAVIPFELTGAHPGDNFAVFATTRQSELSQIVVDGIALRNSVSGRVLAENIDRTPMLTAWRTLHIEHDSMGIIQNAGGTNVINETDVGFRAETINVGNFLDSGRFQNGRMIVGDGNFLLVDSNLDLSITVRSPSGTVTVRPRFLYTLYDDDDFNSDNDLNGFDGDHGEDVGGLPESYDLLQSNDDRDCSDGHCNVFAAAYIVPDYLWAAAYNTSDVFFQQNINSSSEQINTQIDRGRYQQSGENDHFWLVYVQIAYQFSTDEDCDPNTELCTYGNTVGSIFNRNDVVNEAEVPVGSHGSLIYVESVRDGVSSVIEPRLITIPHEIGHQFGIRGDQSEPQTSFGLMGYTGGRTFIDRHLNIIRWRRLSPGVVRN